MKSRPSCYPANDLLPPAVKDVFKIEGTGIVRFECTETKTVKGFSFTFGMVRNIAFGRKKQLARD